MHILLILYSNYIHSNGDFDEKILKKAAEIDNMGMLCDFIAENSFLPIDDKLDIPPLQEAMGYGQ